MQVDLTLEDIESIMEGLEVAHGQEVDSELLQKLNQTYWDLTILEGPLD